MARVTSIVCILHRDKLASGQTTEDPILDLIWAYRSGQTDRTNSVILSKSLYDASIGIVSAMVIDTKQFKMRISLDQKALKATFYELASIEHWYHDAHDNGLISRSDFPDDVHGSKSIDSSQNVVTPLELIVVPNMINVGHIRSK